MSRKEVWILSSLKMIIVRVRFSWSYIFGSN